MCVNVLPLGVVQVFVWSIQVPALTFLPAFCVVHGSSVIFPITGHTLNWEEEQHRQTTKKTNGATVTQSWKNIEKHKVTVAVWQRLRKEITEPLTESLRSRLKTKCNVSNFNQVLYLNTILKYLWFTWPFSFSVLVTIQKHKMKIKHIK